MREAKQIRLRHGYLGPLTKAQIARAEGVSEHVIARFWAAEKASGALPAVRPHFVERSAPVAEQAIEVVIEAEVDLADDDTATPAGAIGPPIYAPNPRFDAASDALLAALRKHHPDLDRDGAQDVSRDLRRFDLRGMPTPTQGMLMAICRAADFGATVRASA